MLRFGALALALVVTGWGCESKPAGGVYGIPREQGLSLYARMGGEPGMRGLVDDLLWRVQADPRVNFARQGTDRPWSPTTDTEAHVKEGFVQYFGQLTGGPQVYRGSSMRVVHGGMAITDAEFDAFMDDARQSLIANRIGEPERSQFLALLAPLRAQIVDQPPANAPRRSTAQPHAPRVQDHPTQTAP